jgi:hypothetical protein
MAKTAESAEVRGQFSLSSGPWIGRRALLTNAFRILALVRSTEFAAVIAGLSLYGAFVSILNWKFHRKLAAVFSRHLDEGPTSAEIGEALNDLNEDSAHFVFTMDRSANIPFREGFITLIYGRVGTRSPGGIRGPVWTLRKTVYAFVPNSHVPEIKRHADIFEPAMSGYRFSIFWVKLDALLREG